MTNSEKKYIIPHNHKICVSDRTRMKGHRPCVIWFTGLSGSGKSTLAGLLEQHLYELGIHTYILDGDNVRKGLNKDLDFSIGGRNENIRRIGELARLMADAGLVVIAAFVSPIEKERQSLRQTVGEGQFLEIFVDTPLSECERRDTKGLYKKARAGVIKNFTGISSPFEPPQDPDIHIRTVEEAPEVSLNKILTVILPRLQTESDQRQAAEGPAVKE